MSFGLSSEFRGEHDGDKFNSKITIEDNRMDSEELKLLNLQSTTISRLSPLELAGWMKKVSHLVFPHQTLDFSFLEIHDIDGYCFFLLTDQDFIDFGLNEVCTTSINIMRECIMKGLKIDDMRRIHAMQNKYCSPLHDFEVSGYSYPTKSHETMTEICTRDEIVYGELVVIGYSEYRLAMPIGIPNRKYVLVQRLLIFKQTFCTFPFFHAFGLIFSFTI